MLQFLRPALLLGTALIITSPVLAQGTDGVGFGGPNDPDAGYTAPGPADPGPSVIPEAMQSRASTGQQFGNTTDSTWQDVQHQFTSGHSTISRVGETQYTNQQNRLEILPTELDSLAVAGGHMRQACGKSFSGGFKSSGTASVLSKIFGLPQTSTSCVDLHTAQ